MTSRKWFLRLRKTLAGFEDRIYRQHKLRQDYRPRLEALEVRMAPAVSLSSPADNAFVRLTVLLQATATDTNLDHVEFFVDSVDEGAGTLNAGVWSFSFNTTTVGDGSHNWSATAFDTAGTGTGTSTRAFTVDNTPPTVGLSVVPTFGAPIWMEQGPGPITGGQTEGLAAQNNPVAGAVEAIAANPTNPNIAVIGTVNGGIWTTGNATASSPTWTPRTDNLPSLSIGAIAYSQTNSNVLYAGTGSFSSGGAAGGPAIGVLKSTDGGATWAQVGGATLNGLRIRSIVPTTLGGGQVILVGAQDSGGVYRSTDGGVSFRHILGGLPAGRSCFSIVADGADPNTFYASLGENAANQGVFRSTDGGVNWTNVSTGITGLGGAAVRIELAAHYDPSSGSKALYCAVIAQANGQLSGIFRSADGGNTWTAMDAIQTNEGGTNFGLNPEVDSIGDGSVEDPGGMGVTHFSMIADRTNEFIVYVGGDRQPAPGPDGIEGNADDTFPNSIGAMAYSGRHFRGDASRAPGSQWYAIDAVGLPTNSNDGANGTSAHADSRELAFDPNGNLLEGDDGGIYRLSNPGNAARTWASVNGNLRVTEFYSVAYDSLNNVIIGGTQDVGSPRQNHAGNSTWSTLLGGDGGVTQVDVTSSPGHALVYSSSQNLDGFNRRTYDSAGNLVNAHDVGLMVAGQSLKDHDKSIQFIQPYVLNAIDPMRMLIGTANLYASTDQGDHLTDLNYGGPGVAISAMAYGGRRAGASNPDVIYAADGTALRLRTTAGGAFSSLSAYHGSSVRDIVLDPDDWERAYVLDSLGHVWRTIDEGGSFTDITGNMLALLPAGSTDLRTIEIYSRDAGPDIGDAILVGGLGGVYATDDPQDGAATAWIKFGIGLPNYLVRDMHYDRADDVLLIGGFGRGAWTVPNLSTFVANNAFVRITITFSEVVTDFDLNDLHLQYNGNPVALTGATLTSGDRITGTLGNLTGQTGTQGSYTLTLIAANSGIVDRAGNALTGDANTSWVIDARGQFSGIIFNDDLNLNGVRDSGEPALPSQVVFLDKNQNRFLDPGEPSTTTDSSGAYHFGLLAPGTYLVGFSLGGVLLSPPSSGSSQVTVTAGANLTGQDFGAVLTSIAVPLSLPPRTPFPAQGNANADFVEAVFRAVLQRHADAGGLAHWTGALNDHTLSRLQVVQGIWNSPEHFGQEVDAFYQTLLGRLSDPPGRAGWVQQLENGMREEDVAFAFLDSPEYRGKGDKFFVDSMYQSLLGRPFDPPGAAYWLDRLGDAPSGNPTHPATLTHEEVIHAFLFSTESLTRLTQGYYEVFLRRPADDPGLTFWLGRLRRGQPFVTAGQQFLASDEFYDRAAANG